MAPSATVGTLRAVLEADASKFTAALDDVNAKTSLFSRDFTKMGASVQQVGEAFTNALVRDFTSINKLTKEFSGAGTAKAADELAAAIGRVGGADKLTASEQQRVNAQVTEALAKYKALGQEAPAHLLKLAEATKQVAAKTETLGGSFTKVFSSLQNVAGLFGIGLGAGAVVGAVKSAVEDASHINDLSEKLSVSTEKIQRWSFALSQTGGSIDNVDTSLSFMNKTLGAGAQGTVDLIASMGFKLNELRAQKPEDTFEQIVKAIAAMPNPLDQSRAAVELFGKSGQDLLPSIREGFLEIAASADVMADKSIQALDRIGDEWDRFVKRQEKNLGDLAGTIAATLNRESDVDRLMHARGGPKAGWTFERINAMSDSELQAAIKVLDALEAADKRYEDQVKKTTTAVALGHTQFQYATKDQLAALPGIELTTTAQKAAAAAAQKAADELRKALEVRRDALARLTESYDDLSPKVKQAIADALDHHRSIEDVSVAYGVNKGAVTEYARILQDQIAAQQALNDASVKDLHTTWESIGAGDVKKQVLVQVTANTWKLVDATEALDQKFLNSQIHWELGPETLNHGLQKVDDTLGQIGRSFEQMATIAGDSFGVILRGIGLSVVGLDQLEKASANFAKDGATSTDQWKASLQAAGPLLQAFSFGVSALNKRMEEHNSVVDQFIALGGESGILTADYGYVAGFDLLSDRFQQIKGQLYAIGAAGRQMWAELEAQAGGTDTVGTAAIIARINAALGGIIAKKSSAAAAHAALLSAYGLTSSKDTAASLLRDFDTLKGDGFSQTSIASAMASRVSALIVQAEKLGEKLPEALRPLLITLAQTGQLSDEAKAALMGVTAAPGIDWKAEEEAASKYGISLEKLGRQFDTAKLSAGAQQLVDDFKLLTSHGEDVGEVMNHMQKDVQGIVDKALKLGVDVPDSMKPMLQSFVDAGLLVDDHGEKLKDLGRINFAKPIEEAVQSLIDKIGELIDTLKDPKITDFGKAFTNPKTGKAVGVTLFPEGDATTTPQWPVMDTPLMAVSSPGLVRVNPGDVVGMPALTPAAFRGGDSGGPVLQVIGIEDYLRSGGDAVLTRAVVGYKQRRGLGRG